MIHPAALAGKVVHSLHVSTLKRHINVIQTILDYSQDGARLFGPNNVLFGLWLCPLASLRMSSSAGSRSFLCHRSLLPESVKRILWVLMNVCVLWQRSFVSVPLSVGRKPSILMLVTTRPLGAPDVPQRTAAQALLLQTSMSASALLACWHRRLPALSSTRQHTFAL